PDELVLHRTENLFVHGTVGRDGENSAAFLLDLKRSGVEPQCQFPGNDRTSVGSHELALVFERLVRGQRILRVQSRIIEVQVEIAAPWPRSGFLNDLNAWAAVPFCAEDIRVDDDLLDLIPRRNAAVAESVDKEAGRRARCSSARCERLKLSHQRV